MANLEFFEAGTTEHPFIGSTASEHVEAKEEYTPVYYHFVWSENFTDIKIVGEGFKQ